MSDPPPVTTSRFDGHPDCTSASQDGAAGTRIAGKSGALLGAPCKAESHRTRHILHIFLHFETYHTHICTVRHVCKQLRKRLFVVLIGGGMGGRPARHQRDHLNQGANVTAHVSSSFCPINLEGFSNRDFRPWKKHVPGSSVSIAICARLLNSLKLTTGREARE